MSLGEFIPSSNTKLLLHLNGSSADSSGLGNNGTDTAITYSQANGRFGQGAGFNGSSSRIAIATSSYNVTGYVLAFATRRDLNTVSAYLIDGWYDNTSVIQSLNTWYLYTLVAVNGGHTFLYLNGKLVSDFNKNCGVNSTINIWAKSATTSSIDRERLLNCDSASVLSIGSFATGAGNFWNGSMDEISMEPTIAWTPQQVAKYYANAKGRYATL
jgi:hypothetical protein